MGVQRLAAEKAAKAAATQAARAAEAAERKQNKVNRAARVVFDEATLKCEGFAITHIKSGKNHGFKVKVTTCTRSFLVPNWDFGELHAYEAAFAYGTAVTDLLVCAHAARCNEELRSLCKIHGLSASGSHAVMIQRFETEASNGQVAIVEQAVEAARTSPTCDGQAMPEGTYWCKRLNKFIMRVVVGKTPFSYWLDKEPSDSWQLLFKLAKVHRDVVNSSTATSKGNPEKYRKVVEDVMMREEALHRIPSFY